MGESDGIGEVAPTSESGTVGHVASPAEPPNTATDSTTDSTTDATTDATTPNGGGKVVVVTGANGHVGQALTRELLTHGYHVRATVRDASDSAKTSGLRTAAADLGASDRFELHSADLMSSKGWPEILAGIDGLFAVAAVFKTRSKNPDEEIVKPSIEGGISLLEAAADAEVPRIVYTSSVAAIGGQPIGRRKNEDDWNKDFSLPYTYAKTEAERRAWTVAEKRGLDLRVVNPSMVWGPFFTRHTPSTEVAKGLLEGAYPAAPKSSFAIVDVRDVATIHRLVFEDDNATGRHIVSGTDGRMIEIGRMVKSQYPEAKSPRFQAPWAFVYLNAIVEQFFSIFGRTPSITWSIVRSIRRGDAQLDTSKSQALGWTPIPFDETIRDTIEWLRQHDL